MWLGFGRRNVADALLSYPVVLRLMGNDSDYDRGMHANNCDEDSYIPIHEQQQKKHNFRLSDSVKRIHLFNHTKGGVRGNWLEPAR